MALDLTRRNVRILMLLSAVAVLPAFAQNLPGRAVRPVGEFSNMRFTEDHAYGVAVELWRFGDSLVGLLLVSEGPQGETPTGLLENVRFSPGTGILSFTAKLTTGSTVLPGGKQEPSRDLFEFSGTLESTVLTGTLKRSGPGEPSRQVSRELIQLKIQPEANLLSAGTYAEWKRRAAEILKLRGPKW